MTKATDLSFNELCSNVETVEFPDAIILRRDGAKDIIFSHSLPISMPDVTCHTTKNFGQGVYTMAFVYTDGTEKSIHRNLHVEEDDRKCPFVGHCSVTA